MLNKVLKDIVVRSQLLMGKRAVFRPGWDCHGLPIEQQVEKKLGKDARALDAVAFRAALRGARAEVRRRHAHRVQAARLPRQLGRSVPDAGQGLRGDDRAPAGRVRRAAGLVYRDKKPVHWCFIHRTALAEAEVEYEDHTSPSIYVRFPIVGDIGKAEPRLRDQRAAFVIWTTTPWTLPANLAVVANPELDYVAIPRDGEYLIVAAGLRRGVPGGDRHRRAARRRGSRSRATGCARWRGRAYTPPFPRPSADAKRDYRLWFARHATLEAGTGLVHTAPGHGAEDYVVGREHGLRDLRARRRARPVHGRRRPAASWPGMQVFEANPKIVADLAERGLLLNKPGETVRHQYPHCWRCKNPIIFRATEQWFARLGDADDETSLRHRALAEIAQHAVDPDVGREPHPRHDRGAPRLVPVAPARLGRADPGVPLHEMREGSARRQGYRARGRHLRARGLERLVHARRRPSCCRRHRAACACGGREFDKQHDIVDVWFESGVSWAAVAEGKLVPAGEKVDLYLEGADQHRGWFHSSLLTAAATRGQAPYKAVLTHGWVLDERGKVYSKSEIAKARAAGAKINYVDPGGLDGEERRRAAAPVDRRRPTTRATSSSRRRSSTSWASRTGRSATPAATCCRTSTTSCRRAIALEDHELRELDLLALGVLRERDHQIFDCYKRYSFHEVVRLMNDYVITVSAEYLDPIKDALYCEAPDVARAAQRADRGLRDDPHDRALDGADPLLHGAGRRRRARARDRRAVRRARRRARGRPEGEKLGNPNKRWTDEIRPRREAILRPLEAFRAAGHKSLEARVRVTPAAAERPHWQWSLAHLAELCVVSRVELDAADAPPGETQIIVDEAPGPDLPALLAPHRRGGGRRRRRSQPVPALRRRDRCA